VKSVQVRLQSMTASRPRPLVHRVERPETSLVGPSKMMSPKHRRLHRVAPLLDRAIFARTEQKIQYLHRLGWGTWNVAGVKSRREVVVRLYLRCGRRLRQMMTGTLHPCSGQCSALEVLQGTSASIPSTGAGDIENRVAMANRVQAVQKVKASR
jgi:hypothetical protein